MKKSAGLLVVLGFFWAVSSSAQLGDAGTESPFALGVDARAIALGRAFTAVADNAGAVYWNTGALAALDKKEFASLYVPLYENTDYAFLAFVYPIAKNESVALGLMGLSTRGIPKTDSFDNDLGEFYDLQLQAMLSYSRVWWNRIAAGINAKLYYHALDTYSGTGLGLDLGVHYDAADLVPGLTLGAMAVNALQPRVTLLSEPDVYPLNVRVGAAYRLSFDAARDHQLLISAEGEKAEYTSWKPHAGVEYQGFRFFSVRAGWDSDHATVGAGLSAYDWRLDYALSFQSEISHLHFFTLGWRFGLSLEEAEAAVRRSIITELAQTKAREHNRRGMEYMKKNSYAKAIEEFEKALSWVDDSAEITKNLKEAQAADITYRSQRRFEDGKRMYEKRNYIEALVAWREVAGIRRDFPGIEARIAAARKAMASEVMQTKLAITKKKTKRAAPGESELREGIDLYLNERYPEAIVKWEAALRVNPTLTQARLYLARVREQMRADQPVASPTVVREENRQEIDRWYNQGLLKYRQRQFQEARDSWAKVLTLDPEHGGAKRGLERIEAILKVFEEKGIK